MPSSPSSSSSSPSPLPSSGWKRLCSITLNPPVGCKQQFTRRSKIQPFSKYVLYPRFFIIEKIKLHTSSQFSNQFSLVWIWSVFVKISCESLWWDPTWRKLLWQRFNPVRALSALLIKRSHLEPRRKSSSSSWWATRIRINILPNTQMAFGWEQWLRLYGGHLDRERGQLEISPNVQRCLFSLNWNCPNFPSLGTIENFSSRESMLLFTAATEIAQNFPHFTDWRLKISPQYCPWSFILRLLKISFTCLYKIGNFFLTFPLCNNPHLTHPHSLGQRDFLFNIVTFWAITPHSLEIV